MENAEDLASIAPILSGATVVRVDAVLDDDAIADAARQVDAIVGSGTDPHVFDSAVFDALGVCRRSLRPAIGPIERGDP
jgi:hypothetical protein